jgi:hypothetical protein
MYFVPVLLLALCLAACAEAQSTPARDGRLLAHGAERGLAVAPDLTLLISDEAVGTRATITGHASSR